MGSTLTLLDVTGIQGFIFGSNRLAENVGASYLVKQALGDWLEGEVKGVEGKLWFSGGGNALVRCEDRDRDRARQLVTALHLKLIEEAPGLGLVCAHRPESPSGDFRATYAELHRELDRAKRERAADITFDGLGVVALAPPGDSLAVSYDAEEKQWLSETTLACRSACEAATQELQGLFALDPGWEWSRDLEKLGRTRGERSLLGVVHFDGNSMGERFRQESSRLEDLRALSEAVKRAGRQTLEASLGWINEHLAGLVDEFGYRDVFPVRPILYGGDDITLVCEGRIALDLAARLLETWREVTQNLPGGPAEACAGVALVPVRYPFYRAYRLAERYCKDAKRFLHDQKLTQCSAIDWALSSGGAEQDRRADSPLTCKPYLLGEHGFPSRDWRWFRTDLVAGWKRLEDKHTQFKSLAEILRVGERETREQLRRWKDKFQMQLPEPAGTASVSGFFDDHTPYLDALEVLDRVSNTLTNGREATPCP